MLNRHREKQDIKSEIKILDISETTVSETAAYRIPSMGTFMIHDTH